MVFLTKSYLDLFRNASDSVKMMGDRKSSLNSSPIIVAISGADSNCRKLVPESSCKHGHSLKLSELILSIILLWRGMPSLPGNQVWIHPPLAFHILCQYLFIIVLSSCRVGIHINSCLQLFFFFLQSLETQVSIFPGFDLWLRYFSSAMAHVLSLSNRRALGNFQLWN